jgi:diadenosine tetraphosphate (Ap4A) HIT family hydrolase
MNCSKDCVFCSLINQTDRQLCSKPENKVLYENDLVLIKPALGMSIPNYLMAVSKQHINGFAELDSRNLFRLEGLLDRICDEYNKIIGTYPIFFEHGSLPEGRHPLSITHAHLHIIPINISRDNLEKLFDELDLRSQSNIVSLHNIKNKDYWMYRSENKHYYMSHSIKDAPQSLFIKLVAQQAGYDNSYEWRDLKNNRYSDIKKTIETFKKLRII